MVEDFQNLGTGQRIDCDSSVVVARDGSAFQKQLSRRAKVPQDYHIFIRYALFISQEAMDRQRIDNAAAELVKFEFWRQPRTRTPR